MWPFKNYPSKVAYNRDFKMNRDVQEGIKKTLAENHTCYVLITCDQQTAGGKMEVEMTYEGDKALASYLLEGAKTIIDEDEI